MAAHSELQRQRDDFHLALSTVPVDRFVVRLSSLFPDFCGVFPLVQRAVAAFAVVSASYVAVVSVSFVDSGSVAVVGSVSNLELAICSAFS